MTSIAIIAIAGSLARFCEMSYATPCDDLQSASTPGTRRPINDCVAITDKGTLISLYEWSASPAEYTRFAVESDQRYSRDFPTIRREESSDHTNCHGWVFTQGRHLLFGDGVEQILQDNGYRIEEQPDVNDVIIYRDPSGKILHSGLVRAVLDDGTVLIESKWGISARYLHLPQNQPYGDNYKYYRSTHTTHVVHIEPRATDHFAAIASTIP